jgi:hypothetical protein
MDVSSKLLVIMEKSPKKYESIFSIAPMMDWKRAVLKN